MRKLLGVVIIGVLIYFSYQWYQQLQEDSKPAIIESVTQSVQDMLQLGGEKLKEELDRIEQKLAEEAKLDSEDSVAVLAEPNEQTLLSDGETYEAASDQDAIDVSDLSTDNEQGIIQFLAQQLDKRSPSMVFQIKGSYQKISDEMPHWLGGALELNEYARYAMASYSYTISNKLLYNEVEFKVKYRETNEMTEHVRAYVKNQLAAMKLSQYTKEQQVKLIHDFIVTNVQYDQSLTRYTAYEAITEGLAVCQGYAMLGYMFYSEAGFDVRIVEGTAKGQEHAWNMIYLNDRWYQLDLTWDDPVGQQPDEISYRYYLVSDEELARDHSWEGNYPVASVSYKDSLLEQASKLDRASDSYEKLQQLRQELGFHWYDEENQISSYDALYNLLKEAVAQRQSNLQFVYLDGGKAEDDISKALRALKTARSYQMSYYEFSEIGDLAISLTLTY